MPSRHFHTCGKTWTVTSARKIFPCAFKIDDIDGRRRRKGENIKAQNMLEAQCERRKEKEKWFLLTRNCIFMSFCFSAKGGICRWDTMAMRNIFTIDMNK